MIISLSTIIIFFRYHHHWCWYQKDDEKDDDHTTERSRGTPGCSVAQMSWLNKMRRSMEQNPCVLSYDTSWHSRWWRTVVFTHTGSFFFLRNLKALILNSAKCDFVKTQIESTVSNENSPSPLLRSKRTRGQTWFSFLQTSGGGCRFSFSHLHPWFGLQIFPGDPKSLLPHWNSSFQGNSFWTIFLEL